jgi:hypothetical protein
MNTRYETTSALVLEDVVSSLDVLHDSLIPAEATIRCWTAILTTKSAACDSLRKTLEGLALPIRL